MKILYNVPIIIYFITVLFGYSQIHADDHVSAAIIDMVVASVDGEPVTMNDLRRYIEENKGTDSGDVLSGEEEIRVYLREYISQVLIEKEAKSANISVGEEDVQAYLNEIKQQNSMDDETLNEALKEKGISYNKYVEQIKRDILRARVISKITREKTQVLDEDVDKFLSDHPELVPQEGAVRIEKIELSGADSKSKLEEIRKLVLAGKTMIEAAAVGYEDLGYVKIDDLREDLQIIAKKQILGKVSDVIDYGNHALIILVSPSVSVRDEKFRNQIRARMAQGKVKDQVDVIINVELPEKYHVEIKL